MPHELKRAIEVVLGQGVDSRFIWKAGGVRPDIEEYDVPMAEALSHLAEVYEVVKDRL